MISSITGQILTTKSDCVVVNSNGVGYKIYTTPEDILISTERKKVDPNFQSTFWTYLAVRENAMDLYGFLNEENEKWFELLITISGIGPKSALSILSVATPNNLLESINQNDPEYLHKTSGLGKKTAQKIIAGLKDKFEGFEFSTESNGQSTKEASLVFEALLSLGYSSSQIREAVSGIDKNSSTQDQIKEALKRLNS